MDRTGAYPNFLQRISLDAPSPETLLRRWQELLKKAPTDRISARNPLGFCLEEEPRWFLLFTFGATLLLGVLGHVLAARVPRAGFAANMLAVVLDLTALTCLALFRHSWKRTHELCVEEDRLLYRERRDGYLEREIPLDPAELTAVLLLPGPPQRVCLVGARNAHRLEVFRESFVDPPSLASWMAQATALVAAAANVVAVHGSSHTRWTIEDNEAKLSA